MSLSGHQTVTNICIVLYHLSGAFTYIIICDTFQCPEKFTRQSTISLYYDKEIEAQRGGVNCSR